MNGKPINIVSRDGLIRSDQLGKEAGWLHNLTLRLRGAGATPEDLAGLAESAEPEFYELMVALMRGVVPVTFPGNLINLDKTPGFPSYDRDYLKLVVDSRLGIHVCDFHGETSRFRLGDRQLCFQKASGCCMTAGNSPGCKETHFSRMLLHPMMVDLNKRGGEWLTEKGMDVCYWIWNDSALPDDAIVFCLGTVWRQLENQHTPNETMSPHCALAIRRQAPGKYTSERVALPPLVWKENHYIAVLV